MNTLNVFSFFPIVVLTFFLLYLSHFMVMETKGEYLEQARIVKLEQQTIRETFHVIQCLGGDAKGFLDEWEVNLKSILLNAPLDYN